MPAGNPSGYKKPRNATAGQATTTKTSMAMNKSGGGALGQPNGSRNRPCKPSNGAQGQRLAGGASKAKSGGKIAHDVY